MNGAKQVSSRKPRWEVIPLAGNPDILIRFYPEGRMWDLIQEKYGCQAPGVGIYEEDILNYPGLYLGL